MSEDKSLDAFQRFSTVLTFVLAVWMGYSTIASLFGSHPLVAIAPGTLTAFFACSAMITFRGVTETSSNRFIMQMILVLGPIASVGIIVLWVAARSTDDRAYRDEAISFSFWGGLIVVLSLLATAGWFRSRLKAREGRAN